MTTPRPAAAVARDLGVGVGVGVFSGALGVGGGIVLVPYLVLVRKMGQKAAQATSLVMVALAATSGATRYAIDDSVAWAPALALTAGGLLGVLLGATVVQRTSDRRLQMAFGVLLVLVALRLLWPTDVTVTAGETHDVTIAAALAYAAAGVVMGVLSSLFGVGGGVILIPVLVGAFGFSQQLANGTSLAVMVPVALLGAIRLTKPGLTQWRSGLTFGVAAIAGAVVGASAALAVSGSAVRTTFAVFMLVVGAQMAWSGYRAPRATPP